MNFIGGMSEMTEVSEAKSEGTSEFSECARNKFDKIMGDDKIDILKVDDIPKLSPEERESKFNKLFDTGDLFKKSQIKLEQNVEDLSVSNIDSGADDNSSQTDIFQKREPNSTYEINGDIYETDDNGDTYKKNGDILPNTEYTVSGNTYKTDEHGNKIYCDSEPSYTEDGTRNTKDQKESGGEERQEDDGGHIIAKILGGSEGEENLVPMRRTINRGDYKKMENEIARALQEGKKVTMHIEFEYDGESQRPSKISAVYTIDGKKTIVEFDNEKNSIELLDSLNEKISNEDYNNLKEEIEDMKSNGIESAVTSVKVEYDENGNPTRVTVGVLDESTGKKTYKVYESR